MKAKKRKQVAEIVYSQLSFGYLTSGPYAYSGRYMHGQECIACDIDSLDEVVPTILSILSNLCKRDRKLLLDVTSPFATAMTDNMGRGYVMYWPSLRWDDDTMEDERDGY